MDTFHSPYIISKLLWFDHVVSRSILHALELKSRFVIEKMNLSSENAVFLTIETCFMKENPKKYCF